MGRKMGVFFQHRETENSEVHRGNSELSFQNFLLNLASSYFLNQPNAFSHHSF